MIFAAYSEALVLEVRAILPLDMEAAVAAQNTPATKLSLAGFRGPFAVRSSWEPVIVDETGAPVAMALPGPSPAYRMLLAEEIAAALNARCGILEPAIADRFDPHHLAAVKAESRRNDDRLNPPQAAE
ncbi:hypothetical protein [Methylobacterium soli]|uniref:Uncharacterized protein n=1 Tax=Methylobacterium soli TaxID=553447 RepID=A0A6L3SRM7_9HYPH|nr:hypothetical protein [Methylobacterium soli]KAB1075424.1 hypothetical protein F6X53_24995 [Methylobacterium soli]GJE41321.1 hypothetical protein AEGHOMDF_0485 [Methylobacterium soli]